MLPARGATLHRRIKKAVPASHRNGFLKTTAAVRVRHAVESIANVRNSSMPPRQYCGVGTPRDGNEKFAPLQLAALRRTAVRNADALRSADINKGNTRCRQ